MRAAFKIAYPGNQGLGEWEPALQIAENQYEFQ